MVSDTSADPTDAAPASDEGSNTAVNAILGGVAGVVLSFIPFSPLLGGAIAGYLEGGRPKDGLTVGTFAGLVMLLPFLLLLFFLLFLLGLGDAPLAFGFLGLFVLFVAALYTVGLSALGGYLGIYVKNEL